MEFLSGADPKVVFAFWLGVAVVIVAVSIMVVIFAMRRSMLRKERNHRRAAAFWRGVLVPAATRATGRTPALPKRDLTGFIEAWNQVHLELQGRDEPALQRIARDVELDKHLYRALASGGWVRVCPGERVLFRVEKTLASGGFHGRLMSLTALGYLNDRAHFDEIARYLDDRSSIVSLSAARALMQLDPQRAVALFVPQIVARPDWSQSGVAQILQEAGPATVSEKLGEVVLQANADVAPRLIRFLAGVSPEQADVVIRKILQSSEDEHLISTCLQVMSSQADLDLVRPLLSRERWHVRMHAASAIGRLGGEGDEHLLVPLLADAQWWVRYRAAQALVRLPSMGDGDVARLRATQTDRFACDILDQVVAEEKIGAQK